MKKAVIIGATGLIGTHLSTLLEKEDFYDVIELWVRKPLEIAATKTSMKIVDFNQLPETIDARDVFCCVGTTIKKAGTREAFRKVDYDIPVNIARLCQQAGVEKLIVISSIGADPESGNNYLRTKGEMEKAILAFNIPSVTFLRPSMLLGKREEFRFGELVGKCMIQLFGKLLVGNLRKYRGIHATTVARAMLQIAKGNFCGHQIIASDEMEKIGKA